ncbi:MAG: VCBS repeat-containing protein, partial [Chloroflexi bacterium]|nr:VCBS repeat-containing protein [Chloroflexota bacterium]
MGAVPAHFVDVTEKAGIKFHYERAATGKKYLVETMGAGCAFLDYDRDGWQDILLIQGKPLPGSGVTGALTMKLYHNNHNGTFTDVTRGSGLEVQMYGMGAAVGDYDNDGYPDIYVTAALGPSHLFHNNRNGTFTDVTRRAGVGNEGMWGTSACWLDYDRDGYLDLFVCNYVRYRSLADDVPCYYQPGVRSYCIPKAYPGSSCRLYHNNHNGTFTDVTRQAGIQSRQAKALAVAVCDINGDGWPDLVVANDTEPNFVYQNRRNGTFSEVGALSGLAYGSAGNVKAGMGVDAADVTGNNTLAIAIANFWGESMAYYRQISSGLFAESGDESGVAGASIHRLAFGTIFLDYDNDGFPDLMFACGHVQNDSRMFQMGATYEEPQLLLHNDGRGRFVDVTALSGAPFTDRLVGRGLAHGDFNNDGEEDILITSNDGRVMLWQNETTPKRHWLEVSLVGVHCNRDALGAA